MERILFPAVGGVEDAFFMEYEITVEVATQPDMMPRRDAGYRERPGWRDVQRRKRLDASRELADRRAAYRRPAAEQRALEIPEEEGC